MTQALAQTTQAPAPAAADAGLMPVLALGVAMAVLVVVGLVALKKRGVEEAPKPTKAKGGKSGSTGKISVGKVGGTGKLSAARPSGGGKGVAKVDPAAVTKAYQKYNKAMEKRLNGKVDQYSVLQDSKRLVEGFYEQKGQIVAARYVVKKAYCKKCEELDGTEISLLDPDKLAAMTPPIHNDVKPGQTCDAHLSPMRAGVDKARNGPDIIKHKG